jgi:hypothetical protein
MMPIWKARSRVSVGLNIVTFRRSDPLRGSMISLWGC